MKEEMRTIGYLCPRCRKPVMQQRARFALAASGAIVQCECGKSELQIDFDGEKFRISVPCGVCGGEHLAECSAERLLDGEGIGLACPETSELCCFIGEAKNMTKSFIRIIAQRNTPSSVRSHSCRSRRKSSPRRATRPRPSPTRSSCTRC